MRRIIVFLTACLLLLPLLAACNEGADSASKADGKAASSESKDPFESYKNLPNVVVIEMKDGGKIKIELYPDIAPITVGNFKKLVSEHFYDGLTFHRVIKGFMIQGGDPKGNGTGGPGYTIKGEFALNGFNNPLSHTRGVISMARSQSYNSAGSQFFIMHADNKGLDGQYAAFGKVIEGMDVVDKIANVKTDSGDKPLEAQVIKSITFLEDTASSESKASASSGTGSDVSSSDVSDSDVSVTNS